MADQFIARGSEVCGSGWANNPWLARLIIAGDLATLAAYIAIPLVLLILLRRFPEAFAYRKVWSLFAGFIFVCGLGHGVAALTFLVPVFWLEAWVGVLRSLLSGATLLFLIQVGPRIVQSMHDAHVCIKEMGPEVRNRLASFHEVETS